MSDRSRLEDRYTVVCKDCGTEWINPCKKPNQKYGQCDICKETLPRKVYLNKKDLRTLVWALELAIQGLDHPTMLTKAKTLLNRIREAGK